MTMRKPDLAPESTPRRPAIDQIRDGLPAGRVKGPESGRNVYGELVSTASKAQKMGWSFAFWHGELSKPSSNLARQAATDRGKDIGRDRLERKFRRAWERAEAFNADVSSHDPDWTKDDIRVMLQKLIMKIDQIDPGDWPLRPQDLRVIRFAVSEGIRLGMTRPALPRNRVGAHLLATMDEWACRANCAKWRARSDDERSELSRAWARKSLDRLTAAGWLELHRKGRPTTPGSSGVPRANVYQIPRRMLAASLALSKTERRPMGPDGTAYGSEQEKGPGQAARPMGPDHQKENPNMSELIATVLPTGEVRIYSPEGIPGIRAAVEALRKSGVPVEDVQLPAGSDNVIPISRDARKRDAQ